MMTFLDGAIYTWGSNLHGQLGHGAINTICNIVNVPKWVESIRPLNFTKISAGGAHTYALTISGALFGWGKNRWVL